MNKTIVVTIWDERGEETSLFVETVEYDADDEKEMTYLCGTLRLDHGDPSKCNENVQSLFGA